MDIQIIDGNEININILKFMNDSGNKKISETYTRNMGEEIITISINIKKEKRFKEKTLKEKPTKEKKYKSNILRNIN